MQRKKIRFQKEEGDCHLKVPKGHLEDVHKVPKGGVMGHKREVRARDTNVESHLHGGQGRVTAECS